MELRAKRLIKRILFGRPIHSRDANNQQISKTVGLAVFASDALSSVAYATQEILLILVAAGTSAFYLSLPIAGAITVLLVVLTVSYRQTIFAYPSGGGAYVVAKDNLGTAASQTAGAALLMDYILTVAVSISSGTDQIVSVFPQWHNHQVVLGLILIAFMTMMNLRGVKESGSAFAVPTYFFIGVCTFTLGVGVFKWWAGSLEVVQGVELAHSVAMPLSAFLVLRAFSSGCTALTGVEAISNGIGAFKAPQSKNAAATMAAMSVVLGVLFLGITFIAFQIKAIPSEQETVISQIGRSVWGSGFAYQLLMAGTTLILIMAANTSYADFPRLCALQAGDGFLPRQLTYKSGRLVFAWGIIFLSAAASILLIVFEAHTSGLIPLYAIGVFLSFTLSQWGMVKRWTRIGKSISEAEHDSYHHLVVGEESVEHLSGWKWKRAVNFVGACASGLVMLIFAITKFTSGAWVTVILIPACIFVFYRIHGHYQKVIRFLDVGAAKADVSAYPQLRTLILIDDVNTGTLRMVKFAKTLGNPWLALHVNFDETRAKLVSEKWNAVMGEGLLKVVHSPFRLLLEPVIKAVKRERDQSVDGVVHVITGQLIVENGPSSFLHSKNARGLMQELQKLERVVVTAVPYHLPRRSALL